MQVPSRGTQKTQRQSLRKSLKQGPAPNSPIQDKLREESKLNHLIKMVVQEAIRQLQKNIQVLTGLVSTL